MLTTDGEGHLRHEPLCLDIGHAADELVTAADPAEIGAPLADIAGVTGTVEKSVDLLFGDAMVAAGGLDRSNFALVDPLFEGGIADAQNLGGFAGRE